MRDANLQSVFYSAQGPLSLQIGRVGRKKPSRRSAQTTNSASLLDIASILPPKQLAHDVASAQKNLPARSTERLATETNETWVCLSFNSIVSVIFTPNKAV